MTTFYAARGSHMNDEQAHRYGVRIQELIESGGGDVTPAAVLSDATKKKSPLHDWFEWDDVAAANGYRYVQAQYLLRSITYRVKEKKTGKEVQVRAFFHIADREEGTNQQQHRFVALPTAANDPDCHAKVLTQAKDAYVALRQRYAAYIELKAIHKAIDALD